MTRWCITIKEYLIPYKNVYVSCKYLFVSHSFRVELIHTHSDSLDQCTEYQCSNPLKGKTRRASWKLFSLFKRSYRINVFNVTCQRTDTSETWAPFNGIPDTVTCPFKENYSKWLFQKSFNAEKTCSYLIMNRFRVSCLLLFLRTNGFTFELCLFLLQLWILHEEVVLELRYLLTPLHLLTY